jgi:hypothetical protein
MSTHARLTLLISALAAAICALASGSLAAGAATRAHTDARVFVAAEGCRGHAFKPRKVVLACADANLYVTGLSYSFYGGSEARASGRFRVNDCTPNCAGGRFHTYRGSVRFFGVVRCSDGRRYFSRARYSFHARGGKGIADVAPVMRCSAR